MGRGNRRYTDPGERPLRVKRIVGELKFARVRSKSPDFFIIGNTVFSM